MNQMEIKLRVKFLSILTHITISHGGDVRGGGTTRYENICSSYETSENILNIYMYESHARYVRRVSPVVV